MWYVSAELIWKIIGDDERIHIESKRVGNQWSVRKQFKWNFWFLFLFGCNSKKHMEITFIIVTGSVFEVVFHPPMIVYLDLFMFSFDCFYVGPVLGIKSGKKEEIWVDGRSSEANEKELSVTNADWVVFSLFPNLKDSIFLFYWLRFVIETLKN